MNELTFRRKLSKYLKKQFHVYPIECGGMSKGIPDLYIMDKLSGYGALWVELKAQEVLHVNNKHMNIAWREGQLDFARKYHDATGRFAVTLLAMGDKDIYVIPTGEIETNDVDIHDMFKFHNFFIDWEFFAEYAGIFPTPFVQAILPYAGWKYLELNEVLRIFADISVN